MAKAAKNTPAAPKKAAAKTKTEKVTPVKQTPDPEQKTAVSEEQSSYDQELNRRIDPARPEGGTPPVETFDLKVTEDVLEDNPELAKEGIRIGDVIQVEKEDNVEVVEDPTESDLEILARYKKHYPAEEVFHIASDGQVFLDANFRDAKKHADFLGTKLRSHRVY